MEPCDFINDTTKMRWNCDGMTEGRTEAAVFAFVFSRFFALNVALYFKLPQRPNVTISAAFEQLNAHFYSGVCVFPGPFGRRSFALGGLSAPEENSNTQPRTVRLRILFPKSGRNRKGGTLRFYQ